MTGSVDFDNLVDLHYAGLYRFALSLARDENHAADLTQQTFYIWAAKGHQLQDRSKAKSWLYTTLHREFLGEAESSARRLGLEFRAAILGGGGELDAALGSIAKDQVGGSSRSSRWIPRSERVWCDSR